MKYPAAYLGLVGFCLYTLKMLSPWETLSLPRAVTITYTYKQILLINDYM